MAHGAIQTTYRGFLFRSRLEARWAVFFDALGIEWKYETQGFQAGGHRYLPDFYLPRSNDWVEVKGDPAGFIPEIPRMKALLAGDSPLPGFASGDADLLILGDIPRDDDGTVFHQLITRRMASSRSSGLLSMRWFFFGPNGDVWAPIGIEPTILFSMFGREWRTGVNQLEVDEDWRVTHGCLPTAVRFSPVFDAYRAARQARFEHGERGGAR